MIDEAVKPMQSDEISVVNLVAKLLVNMNSAIKHNQGGLLDSERNALAFSHKPIPTLSAGVHEIDAKAGLTIIPDFRRERLLEFSELSATPPSAESVDMMRFLEHGYQVEDGANFI